MYIFNVKFSALATAELYINQIFKKRLLSNFLQLKTIIVYQSFIY